METQAVGFIDFILALSPIAAVLVLMVGFKWTILRAMIQLQSKSPMTVETTGSFLPI